MLDQRAAGAMDDALRHAGGAGRIQDVERMVERQRVADQRLSAVRREKRVPSISTHHRAADGGQLLEDGRDLRALVEALAAVLVTVGRNEQFWLDLSEPIED